LKGTREAVLNEIELWARDFSQPPVYWLNGLAGTGKSTVAQTIAERLFASGKLGASFFCSRDFSERSSLQFIFPTLAVQLARKYPGFRTILVPSVQSDPGIVDESLYNQMDKLIVQPLRASEISTVIVIDALDECKDDKPASAILSVLGQFVSTVPKVKFFLTGRPEPWIFRGFHLPQMAEVTDVFILHEVEPSQVYSDIRLFFIHSFSEISHQHGLDNWPSAEQLDLLCMRAAGLFVYAAATVKFIGHRNHDPEERLVHLLKSSEDSSSEGRTKLNENTTLDSLYMLILQEAFDDNGPEYDLKARSILGAVILPTNPLSPSMIATILGFPAKFVYCQLLSVHSLLILQKDSNQPVLPFHKSFPDFIINPNRCTNQRFCIPPSDHHFELLIGCLRLMSQGLEKNMCKLPDAVLNGDIDDLQERTEQCIDHSLQYACTSWHRHLVNVTATSAQMHEITSVLHKFIEEKFLFWLEVLSVLGAVREAVDALKIAAKWFEMCACCMHSLETSPRCLEVCVCYMYTLDVFPKFTHTGFRYYQSLTLLMTALYLSLNSLRS